MEALSRTARNAALLLGVLLVFFLTMSLQVNRGQTLAAARSAVTGVTSPAQRVGINVGGFFTGLWDRYIGLVGAARENEQLREQVAELNRRAAAGDAAQRENRRLRGLQGARNALPGRWVGARVAGRDFTQRFQTLTIDRGSRDGVRVDAVALGPGGAVVGRVIETDLWTSTVQLVTDPLSAIGARLVESRAMGLLSGMDSAPLQLDYISSRAEVALGEVVVTSGEDGIYPPDLRIGAVQEIEVGPPVPGTPRVPLMREESALFRAILVVPFVDMLALENLLVSLPAPEPAAPSASESEEEDGDT